jgi:hypothetical protein
MRIVLRVSGTNRVLEWSLCRYIDDHNILLLTSQLGKAEAERQPHRSTNRLSRTVHAIVRGIWGIDIDDR